MTMVFASVQSGTDVHQVADLVVEVSIQTGTDGRQ